MTTYNSQEYVEDAIASVLEQTLTNWELLIVDDCSTDDTLPKIESRAKADDRIVIIRNDRNMGPGSARNAGINRSRGEWVALLDADDWWERDRLEELINFGEQRHLDVVLDDLILHDEVTHKSNRLWSDVAPSVKRYLGHDVKLSDICGTSLSSFHPVVRRSSLQAAGIRYPDVRRSEDFGFLVEVAWSGLAIAVYPGAKYHYRLRNSGKGLSMYRGIYQSRRHYAQFMRSHQSENVSQEDIQQAIRYLKQQARMGYRMYVLRKMLNTLVPNSAVKNALVRVYHLFREF